MEPLAAEPSRRAYPAAEPLALSIACAGLAETIGSILEGDGWKVFGDHFDTSANWRWVVYAGTVALSWGIIACRRRAFLDSPPLEPGEDEDSWRKASDDLWRREILRSPGALALAAIALTLPPLCVWWDSWSYLLVMVCALPATGLFRLAELIAKQRAVASGHAASLTGSAPPPGWAFFGALSMALALVWWTPGVSGAGEDPRPLLVPSILLLRAFGWWWAGRAWRGAVVVDRRLDERGAAWARRRQSRGAGSRWFLVLLCEAVFVFSAPPIGIAADGWWLFSWAASWGLILLGASWFARRPLAPPPPARYLQSVARSR